MNDNRLWWQRPLRVIQTNLQVRDTPKMDPARIASEIREMGANTLVTNVGGIYAWYPSRVAYHKVNEYLPADFDLLGALIDECHKRDIRLVARYDFSKAEDRAYQERPWWFIRDPDNSPHAYGVTRPGNWSLLYTTCVNGGYRNEDVAVPVIRETLERYDIDGIFFNAPHYERCYCDSCRRKYKETYGVELPLPRHIGDEGEPTFAARRAAPEMEKDWPSICVRDNIAKIYGAVKEKASDLPVILYYSPYKDNLNDRTATADMLCTESQDVLSRGYAKIPQFWHPAISMKTGNTAEHTPRPFGIIHSCPGMDWRHTGLPPAEHLFWMAQVPANGGSIWHSLTGFNDTIGDKRLLRTVSTVNHMTEKVEQEMDGATLAAKTLLIWNSAPSGEGWAECLINTHQQFALLSEYQLTAEKLAACDLVILPAGAGVSPATVTLLTDFVKAGGSLIIEEAGNAAPLAELAGIGGGCAVSEYLAASYLRFEEGCGGLRRGFEDTELLAHRGVTAYCAPLDGTRVLATLVPPFAPLEAVGAPPERASMNITHTDLPLITLRELGEGKVLYLSFRLSELAQEYKLGEHYALAGNCVDLMLGQRKAFSTSAPCGVQAVVWEKGGKTLCHFINGIGQRPLVDMIPVHGLTFTLRTGRRVLSVEARISGQAVDWKQEGDVLTCALPLLEVWDMIVVDGE